MLCKQKGFEKSTTSRGHQEGVLYPSNSLASSNCFLVCLGLDAFHYIAVYCSLLMALCFTCDYSFNLLCMLKCFILISLAFDNWLYYRPIKLEAALSL